MLENFIETHNSNNREEFLEQTNPESLVIGATNSHVFSLDLQFRAYFKEAYVIYRQGVSNAPVLVKSYNETIKEITIEEFAENGMIIPPNTEPETEPEPEENLTEDDGSEDDLTESEEPVDDAQEELSEEEIDEIAEEEPTEDLAEQILPNVTSYLITEVSATESLSFIEGRSCTVQLKLVDFEGKISYSDLEYITVVTASDIPSTDELLPNNPGDDYADVYEE